MGLDVAFVNVRALVEPRHSRRSRSSHTRDRDLWLRERSYDTLRRRRRDVSGVGAGSIADSTWSSRYLRPPAARRECR